MPTYTYRCNNCDYEFEVRQRMVDEPLTDCPECKSENTLRKVLNSVGIVFKGSGFYVTDSRGKKSVATPPANGKSSENGDSAKTPEPAAKESSSKTETKSDKSDNGSNSSKGTTEKTAV